MDNEQISGFYDDFSAAQEETGINERLISLFRRMKNLGLKSETNILELGCGVGAFTKMLAKAVKTGKIEAVDLSPKSIAAAKRSVTSRAVHFEVADIVNYKPKNSPFHFITLMDVIEHIPLEKHPELFRSIASYSDDSTRILINIPNPYYLDHLIKNDCDDMQIIDQPVWFAQMVKNLDDNGLEITFFEKYSIWNFEDYDFFIIRKKQPYQLKSLSGERKMVDKAINRIKTKADKLRYR